MADSGLRSVGLVLGAGGVLGGAWLTGALHAIASETGWDPGSSDYIVGTSAGAMVGALLACGVPPWFMLAHSAGEEMDGLSDARGESASSADRAAGARYRLHRGLPALGPGSWRLAVSSLARPYKHSPAALLAGWLPHGPISTEPLEDEHLDLVVALNPMSSLHAGAPRTLGERMALAIRQASGRRLGNEAKRLRAAGSEVVLIQPTVHDLDVMGSNLMSRSRRHEVIETAARSVREHLRESPIGELLAALPKGQPELVRRPEGSARSWTDFRTLARMRWNDSADAAA